MDRSNEQTDDDVIELGAVSAETKGNAINFDDHMGGERLTPGITND